MEATVRVIARRVSAALVVGAVAAAGVVGMGHPAAATASRSDSASFATPARKVHGRTVSSTQFQTISESFTAANFETKILLCPSGTPFVVGGGAQVATPRIAVLSRSYPISGPVPADGWAAAGYASYATHVTLVLYAICTA